MLWQDLLEERGSIPEWPYPVRYGEEREVVADVLVLGGGIAGCHAAISAAKRGARVVVVDKGPVIRSGSGGAGVDHWHGACTNPCSKITPEEFMGLMEESGNDYFYCEYGNGITCYIMCKESYDALLDVEAMGIKVRDVDDEFKGAPFRDEATKLMFAYDYEHRHCIRVNGGKDIKVALYKELKRLGVTVCDRVMLTSLLTEGGRQGGRVVGATGLDVRTGEFYVFKAKASILSTGGPSGVWIFSTELNGFSSIFGDPNNRGEGTAAAWEAGAELALMEQTGRIASGGFLYPLYSTGNCHNTWYACSIVDARGREVPWVDRDGNIIKTVEDRYYAAEGQKFFFYGRRMPSTKLWGPQIIPDLPEKIKAREFVLPLYADLPSMPDHERRAIWGLMMPHEGKTWIVYHTFNSAGFDPSKDMLQVNVMPPDRYTYYPWWASYGPRQWREASGGGLVFDWDLRTSLEGLYVAGTSCYAGGDHSVAATTGRYAGRKAWEYARGAKEPVVERAQIEREKARIYAPVRRKGGVGWKELRAGLARIMQDYCGEFRNEETLRLGLKWLKAIKENEAKEAYARNPHELMRTIECFTHITVGEIITHASLARKASSNILQFFRLDYPEVDPPEWNKLVTLKQSEGSVEVGELPHRYWLLPPNAASYEENYRRHASL
jgi:succinate dehydrogenase/fumarate reductase flavoprotein subunit